jgi:hypothetical protein
MVGGAGGVAGLTGGRAELTYGAAGLTGGRAELTYGAAGLTGGGVATGG